MTTLTSV